jgi:hypothetical protein
LQDHAHQSPHERHAHQSLHQLNAKFRPLAVNRTDGFVFTGIGTSGDEPT